MKVETKATVINNESKLSVTKDNQTVEFVKWTHGKGVSIIFPSGVIEEPNIEIAFQGDQLEKILEFLKK